MLPHHIYVSIFVLSLFNLDLVGDQYTLYLKSIPE